MLKRRARSIAAAIAISAVAAVAAAGCGSSSTTTVTGTSGSGAGGSTTGGGSGGGGGSAGGGSGGGGGSNPLAGITPPPGSTKLSSRSGSGVAYARYSTSSSPAQVTSSYKQQLTGKGWTVVNRGGSGGGWGPYGGSSTGVTAKKNENDYVDVQAGGQSGQKTYFEVCGTTGKGTRSDCDRFSDEANHHTQSGGSQSGASSHTTTSGGS